MPPDVLIIDDDPRLCRMLRLHCEERGLTVQVCSVAAEAFSVLLSVKPKVVLLDLWLGTQSGLEIFEKARREGFAAPTIIVTAHNDLPTTVRAIQLGAQDYVTKPLHLPKLDRLIDQIIGIGTVSQDSVSKASDAMLIGRSSAMQSVFEKIGRVAGTTTTVLITGESGTGKELVARAIHDYGGRPGRFVPINCSAVPQELIESELFGYEEGAFTGGAEQPNGEIRSRPPRHHPA